MEDKFDWKSYYQQEPIEPDIYFKFVCFYQAMTELYDRRLTNERSPYDKTEAFISEKIRGDSEWYSRQLYSCIGRYIWEKPKCRLMLFAGGKQDGATIQSKDG